MQFPEKKVFSIEYFGESEMGKTHNALTYPSVAICDTISEGEVWQVAEKFDNKKVMRASKFDDIRRFVQYCVTNPKIESVAIDSGADLREMAEAEYLGVTPDQLLVMKRGDKVKSVYSPSHGGVEYRHVNNKIDALVEKVKRAKKFLIVTSRVRDEYVQREVEGQNRFIKSGKKIHDGYRKFTYGYGLSVRVRLVNGIEDDEGKTHFVDRFFGKVIKNRFIPKRVQKPYFFDSTYQGLVENGELFEVWCKNFEKSCDLKKCVVCSKCAKKNLIEEARKYLINIGELEEDTIDEA